MAADENPLLNLDTLIERPTIAIDGTRYEIRTPEQSSALDLHRLQRKGQQIQKLMAAEAMTEAEEETVTGLVDEVSDWVMVGVPEAVREKLSFQQRLTVVEVFTRLPLLKALRRAAGATTGAAAPSTGERPQQGSSASMAAAPWNGSAMSPSPLSGAPSK